MIRRVCARSVCVCVCVMFVCLCVCVRTLRVSMFVCVCVHVHTQAQSLMIDQRVASIFEQSQTHTHAHTVCAGHALSSSISCVCLTRDARVGVRLGSLEGN